MWRYSHCNGMDIYSRYLNVSLYRDTPLSTGSFAKVCNGHFGQYLKDRLEIQRIPYGLSMADMIVERALIPDLFVRLPSEYFVSWKDFPGTGDFEIPEELESAAYHSVYISTQGNWSLESLLHPYDEELRSDFVDRFSGEVPRTLKKQKHSNGDYFRPYEAYFSYWKSYIFVEALDGYEHIDKFLSWKTGQEILISRFTDVSQQWEEEYKDVFTRLSFYRTAKTILTRWEAPRISITCKELSEFIQKVTDCNPELLEQDMEKLLILFGDWKQRQKEGRRYYPQAIELLRQDIYFLLEWLCLLTNKPQEVYFKKWSEEATAFSRCAKLSEAIPYEEFELESRFMIYAPDYAETLKKEGYLTYAKDIYARLAKHESFWPWIRAFSDLHDERGQTSSSKPLVFRQPRVLDHLLVFAIRTEILIRAFFRTANQSEECRELRLVFNEFSKKLPDGSRERSILGAVSDKNTWKKTELSGKPEEIFENIDKIPRKKKWNKSQHHIFLSILRFVATRNYFAHHFYVDRALNNIADELTGKIVDSCLKSVIYMDYVVQEIISKCQMSKE